MGQNLAYKLMETHCGDSRVEKGAEMPLTIDQVLTTDTLGFISFLQFEALGRSRIKTKLAVCYVDHNILQTGPESANDHRFLQTVTSKYGAYFSKPGNGICHQLHYERFGVPGETLLGTDSHTPTAGGLGMLAIGAGGLDITAAMAGSPFYLSVPEVVHVRLTGKLPPWTSAKDVGLEVLRRFGVRGGRGKILEYGGPGVETFSIPERASIANMGTETGATTSVFPSDSITRDYLRGQGRGTVWKEQRADPDARYDEAMEIDLSKLEPLVAKPHSPGNVVPVKEVEGIKSDQIIIGSCTNSSARDLMIVAHILKSKKVHRETSVAIAPGSRMVLQFLSRNGYLSDLIEAGVRILEPACGPCIGMGLAPPSEGISLRTFNRNFKGRSGTPDAQVFLVSPETAAASALTGKLTDPRTLGMFPKIHLPEGPVEADDMILPPAENPEEIAILRGPNIKPIELPGSLASEFEGTVLLKLGDDITTDHIVPAGAKAIPLRSNIPALSELIFEAVDSTFAKRAKEEGGGVIVAGENYGQGSSREHAALCPRYLGIKAILAKSFARIHRDNLINFGIIPLTLTADDYARLEQGDALRFAKVRQGVTEGDHLELENVTHGYTFSVRFHLTHRERTILMAGGLLNYIKNNLPGG